MARRKVRGKSYVDKRKRELIKELETLRDHNSRLKEAVSLYELVFGRNDVLRNDLAGKLKEAALHEEMLARNEGLQRITTSLEESETNPERTQRITSPGYWSRDAIIDQLEGSTELSRLFGLVNRQYITFSEFLDRTHPDGREPVDKAAHEALSGMGPCSIDDRDISADDTEQVIHAEGDVTRDNAGQPSTISGTVQDITGRKNVEEALRVSEAKYRDLVENANSIILRWDLEGNLTFFNEFAEEFFGYPAGEVLGKSVVGTIVPASESTGRDLAAMIRDIELNPDRYKSNVNENVRRNGERVWVSWTNKAIRDARGNVIEVLSVGNDITEHKLAEDALLASEARYRTLIENSPVGIFTCDLQGNTTSINPQILEIMGSESPEFTMSVNNLTFEPMIKSGIADLFRDCIMTGEDRADEGSYTSYWGKSGYMRLHLTPLRDNTGQIYGILGITEDVTERKLAEEALRESEEKFRALADTSHGFIAVHRGSKILYVNKQATKISEYSKDELLNMNFWEIFPPDMWELIKERAFARLAGKPVPANYEARVVTREGKTKWVDITAGLFTYEGKPAVILTLFDITNRVDAEEALKKEYDRAELYLDLMGHDINNKNQIAMGFLELIASDESLDPGLQKISLSALQAVSDSSQIIANVRKLHGEKSGEYKPGVFDLGALVDEVAGQYKSVPDKNVKITLGTVKGVRVQADELLRDVFANLIGNAIKHSGKDALIDIGMVPERRDGREYCLVTVEDNGPGVPDDMKDRIFNRMQRGDTKASGSGLGLYLVKSLVEGYGGMVWVEDRVKGDRTKGAKFVVMLPAI
jgi:PAS domain S-box-containing protein